MLINAFTNAILWFLSYTSRIHTRCQVTLVLKIRILVFCTTRHRDKEVFYLMMLSTAKIIYGMWYRVGGMAMTKESRSDGKVKVHPGTGHVDTEGEQRYSSTLSLT